MANFSGADATFEKPYLIAIAEQINAGTKIDINGSKQIVEKSDEILALLSAISSNSQTKVDNALKDGKFLPIFNGYTWTKINKAPFSGSGGSGAGAEVTALTESLQCFYCSLAFNILKRKLTTKDLSTANLEKAGKFCDTDRSLKDAMKKGPADWVDQNVYMLLANVIFDSYRSKFSGNVYFHRGSKFMTNLYAAKTITHKADKKGNPSQAPGSFGHDKWNPGDIWATTFPSSAKPLHDSTDSWGSLNSKVADLAGLNGGKASLLGISLKKSTRPTVKEYRNPSASKHKKASYKSFVFGKRGDFFSSQDIYLNSSAGVMQCRTFNAEKSWQGEVKAISAAGGKIGGGNLDFYSNSILGKSVYGKASGEAQLFGKVNLKNEKWLKEYYDLYAAVNGKQSVKVKTLSFAAFKTELKKQPRKFINSKYACLYLALALSSSPKSKLDKFTDAIFRYASSDTDQSSFYIKAF